MRINIHTQIAVADNEVIITKGDKVTTSIDKVDERLLKLIANLQEKFLNQLAGEVEHLGYRLTHRTAPLFPVPDHL